MSELRLELPRSGVDATITLHEQYAPTVCGLIVETLQAPLETHTSHACFAGHQVYCALPPTRETPPVENTTIRVTAGDVLFFYAGPNSFAWMQREAGRVAPDGPGSPVYELAFTYGISDLSYFASEGWQGSLVGRITAGLDEFGQACARTLVEGQEPLRLSCTDA